jgi:D-glycero-D-manno-heptose 1,7-bisphosphate phosphatase
MNPSPHANKALFLDRDGVVNHEVGYLHRPEDVRWIPGIHALCRTAQSLGYKLVIVTNQSGIARGLYTEQQFHALMEYMRAELALEHIHLDAVYHCPFHPREGIGEYKRESDDRKPSPGMLLRAARDLSLDLTQSILIGDRCSDIAAANAAHLRQAFLLAGTEENPCPGICQPILTLTEAQTWLTQNP